MDLSRRALALLRDASQAPVEIVHCPRTNPSCTDYVVRRVDRRGGDHQRRTLDALLRAGLMQAEERAFIPTAKGLGALRGDG